MKTAIVNPEMNPHQNGITPEAMPTKRSTERNSRPELISNTGKLTLCTRAGINKLYSLQWDITSFRLYKEANLAIHDITAKAWILLYEAEQEQSDEQPIFTIIRAIREWIRETRSNGVSYNETTEDAEGNTVERWNQQPARNNTESEGMLPLIIDEAAAYIVSNTRTHYDIETVKRFLDLICLYDYPAHRAASELKISSSAKQVILNAWKEYRNT